MKNCKHNWVLIGTNELGTWHDCTICKTTGLNKPIKNKIKYFIKTQRGIIK